MNCILKKLYSCVIDLILNPPYCQHRVLKTNQGGGEYRGVMFVKLICARGGHRIPRRRGRQHTNLPDFPQNCIKQECIPVGCVLPAH